MAIVAAQVSRRGRKGQEGGGAGAEKIWAKQRSVHMSILSFRGEGFLEAQEFAKKTDKHECFQSVKEKKSARGRGAVSERESGGGGKGFGANQWRT